MKEKSNNSYLNKEVVAYQEVSPKIDVVFKNIFGKKGNEKLIEDLLYGILGRKVKCELVIKEGRVGEVALDSKYGSLDLLIRLENGEYVDVDMQILPQVDIPKRMVTYASYLTAENLEKKENYSNVKQKIIIFLVDFNMYPKFNTALHQTVTVFEENREEEFTNVHKYYIVELGKMESAKKNPTLYKWLAFLNQNKEALEKVDKDKYIEKANEELKYLAGDPETRRIIWLRKKYIYEMNSARTQGVESGIIEGKEQIALKMLKKQMSINMIMDITGLSKKRVKELKSKNV